MSAPESHAPAEVRRSLSDAARVPFWTDRSDAPPPRQALTQDLTADLVIVGGGLTGLWTAIEAKRAKPDLDVVVLEAASIAFGASGRNGGFISESLTHGIAHGLELWPDELPLLLELGRENLRQIEAFLLQHGVTAHLRLCGKSAMATREHQVGALRESVDLHRQFGEDAEFLDRESAQADIQSPTFLAGMRVRSGGGLVDPALLTWGLADVAHKMGVRIFESTPVESLNETGAGICARTPFGSITADKSVLATNAFDPLLRRLRRRVLPIYDHVLVTEPLTASQQREIGWAEQQGLTDLGNQFHYSRITPDGRILWGGYDAVYYFGNRTDAAHEQRDASHELLAQQFFDTFPQLEGLRFTHRWAGLIDSTSRFTPVFGTALHGKVAYSVGYTGLGVGASRVGARIAYSLLFERNSPLCQLELVRRKPMAFPPEPLRFPTVQFTRRALAAEDESGRRGLWLRLLDHFGVGFNS